MNNWKETLEFFVRSYYQELDESVSIDNYDYYFDWQDYKIINNGHVMSTKADYATWYDGVLKTMVNKKHILKTLSMRQEEDLYRVHIDMHFMCEEIDLITKNKRPVEVNGRIDWLVKAGDQAGTYKIKEYLVTI